ncbi:hypothetical protein [Haloferula sp. BvORR071]|uniref:hypothetical protein n=1 Tax=Haloferula sp. BvORR071 TaxID=1396141 RepID=UPI00054F0814|nr:hypothetical protein [Haloferula sp. BvORR071]
MLLVRVSLVVPALFPALLAASPLDSLRFGDEASEKSHALSASLSEVRPGGLGEASRLLLPGGDPAWQGGTLKFHLKVDPAQQNYFTLRLWGSDESHNHMLLFIDGKQIGYRHLGDYEALDLGSDGPAFPGRFSYRTGPLPLALTKGKESIDCEIRAYGPLSAYANQFDDYQKPMRDPSRGLYRAYTHTESCFIPPADEKQGSAPASLQTRTTPGPEVMDAVKARVDGEIERLLRDPARPANQMQALFLAKAYHTPWCKAAGKPETVTKVLASLDALYRGYVANPKLAEEEPSTWNPDWFGLGPSGQAIQLLEKELKPHFDESIDDGTGKQVKRREAFRAMLLACRDWHREHRRQYTNQSMINDLYGIYLANRGIAVLDPTAALPEAAALRYLHESVGLAPWLGSEQDGKPQKPLGDDYLQLTAKGLTRELGFVGNYGEVLDWVAQIYDATRTSPGQPGDPALKNQLIKIARARAPFRYPLQDRDGFRAMVQETAVGWRDVHYPGDVTYTQRPSWDGNPLETAATTGDPQLLGGVQQMLEDNQLYATLVETMKEKGFRTTFGLLAVPDQLEKVGAPATAPRRLPMSADQPDFVFSDEEDGVVAIKSGEEILYASLYWRARHGVNFLGRVHYMTPEIDRIATVAEEIQFTPSGMDYKRPDWTNFAFGNGGPRYPKDFVSAHSGEILPIAKIPEGVSFKPGQENIHAGRGDFYQLRYGPYLIAMNMSMDKSFDFKAPDQAGLRNLVTGKDVAAGATAKIGPRTTVVLRSK